MDFDEAKKRLKIALVLCVLGCGGWWAFARLTAPAAGGPAEAAREAAPPPAPVDPVAALVAVHRAAGAAKDWPRQASLWTEIVSRSADAPSRRRLIQDDRASWLLRALKENDDASADLLAAAMIVDTANDEINPRHALKEWRARQFEKWRAARAAKNDAAASAALAAMSAWEPLDSDLPRDLVAAAEPAELLTLAQAALKDHAPASAAVLLRAVLMARGDRTRALAQSLFDDAVMGLAADPALARPRPDGPPPSVDLYLRVSGPRRTEALSLAAAIIEARADELLDAEPGLCGPLYDEAQRRLTEAASRERRPPDEAAVARLSRKSLDARLSATLKLLDTSPEAAFAELRPLLRDGKDEDRRQRALEAMVEVWRKARDAKSFDRLVDLSAFLIAEVGTPPLEDPFYAEFKTGLAAMAADAEKESLNKRVFALSLLADAFPDDPEARAARREAAARGAELARAAAGRGAPPEAVGTSGLAGRSVALVENGTAHHILMLYEGPETFFVRVNPYRRGSVVLKDGKYLVGVATIKDEIAPYAVEAAFGEVLVRQKFVVGTRGPSGPEQSRFGLASYGNWTILRAPDGEKFTANPMNGTVRP
ncbi:MAG: hypothetical protein HYV14_09540 [Elusimicrobia bacterium]|nr:hypothetical protein [Elusimicrobiota bacterium]